MNWIGRSASAALHVAGTPMASALKPLAAAIKGFDFGAALEKLAALPDKSA